MALNGTTDIPWEDIVVIYNTTIFAGKMCWPSPDIFDALGDAFKEKIDSMGGGDFMTEVIADLNIGWPIIAASVGIALVIGGLYMVFLMLFAGVIVWVIIVLFFALMAFLGYLLNTKSTDIEA